MKHFTFFLAAGIFAQALLATAADSKSEVLDSIKKLAEKSSYAWTATFKSDGGNANWKQGPTEGKAEKGGYTYLTSSIGDTDYEVAFKGTSSAIKWDSDWVSSEALQGEEAWIARRLKEFKAPAAEAEELATKAKELKKGDDGLYSGDLTEEGVKGMFSRMGRSNQNAETTNAKGSVKFWLKDGALVKYQFNMQGKVSWGPDQEFDVNRTSTVEIKTPGATKLSVPDEAKKKLS